MPATLVQEREKKVLIQEEEKEAIYSDGIKVKLTKEEIQEAIDWGAENKDSPENIDSAYRFGEWESYKECGYISTKFYRLARFSCQSARSMYKSLTKSDIKGELACNSLTIVIYTYGDKIDFAQHYYMVLKQGDKIIQPKPGDVIADDWADMTARWPKSPSYRARVMAFFRYSKINPKAKTTIILDQGWGESKFEVDFSRYK